MPKFKRDKITDELESLLLELKSIEEKLKVIEESGHLGKKTSPEKRKNLATSKTKQKSVTIFARKNQRKTENKRETD